MLLEKKTGGVMETALDMAFARNPLTSPFCSLSNCFDCTGAALYLHAAYLHGVLYDVHDPRVSVHEVA